MTQEHGKGHSRGKMKFRASRITVLVLAALLFMAVNILATTLLTSSRIDLTAQHLYTLSDGTRQVLKGIGEPVTLKFYFSGKTATDYPVIKSYGQRIRDLLNEYAALSQGKIRLEVIDPEPFTPAEDAAVAAGMKAVQTSGGDPIYLGLVGTNSTDTERNIPYFARERENFLEYDLTKLVDELAHPKRPVIGLITSLPLEYGPGGPMAAMRGQSNPYVIYDQLQQSFEMRPLKEKFSDIDPDVDMLLIAHPENLGHDELYAIDQFVLGGGRALIFVDPRLESAAASAMTGRPGQTPPSSDMEALFDSWGLKLVDGKVVADKYLAQRVSMADANGMRTVKDYLPWLAVDKDHLGAADPVTAELGSINLASAGALVHDSKSKTAFEPLIFSSKDAELLPVSQLAARPDPDALLQNFKASGKSYVIAARLTGPAKSAYEKAPDEKLAAKYLASSKGSINVIVVADADMLEDRFWVQSQDFFGQRVLVPMADNGALVVNAADNLTGSNALISLRSRGVSNRPFTVVERIRKAAESRFMEEEKTLQAKLDETEQQIKSLESGDNGAAILDTDQAAAIEQFRQQMLQTRRQLRDVQHNMRRDIEVLGNWVRFMNIGLVPLLVIAFAMVMAYRRQRRRRPNP